MALAWHWQENHFRRKALLESKLGQTLAHGVRAWPAEDLRVTLWNGRFPTAQWVSSSTVPLWVQSDTRKWTSRFSSLKPKVNLSTKAFRVTASLNVPWTLDEGMPREWVSLRRSHFQCNHNFRAEASTAAIWQQNPCQSLAN